MKSRQLQSSRQWLSLLSVVQVLRKRKWILLLGWTLGSAATVAIVFSLRPVYTANAIIQVESQSIPESFVTATVQTALEARLDMLKQQVLVRDRMWKLIEELNLYPRERQRLAKEEVLAVMREDMNIDLVRGWSTRGPGAFQVEYRAPKAELAAEVANRIGMFFINENLRQRTDEALGTSEFLDQQLAEAEKRLRERETVLKEFKLTHIGELPQQEGALLADMTQSRIELLGIQDAISRAHQNKLMLETSLTSAETELKERQELERREAARGVAPANELSQPVQVPIQTDLQRAQQELQSLRARYFDSHPDVQRVLAEVKRLEGEPGRSGRNAIPPQAATAGTRAAHSPNPEPLSARQQETASPQEYRIRELKSQLALVEPEIQTLESRRKRILAEVGASQSHIRGIPAREQELASITRDYETCKANYQSLLNKKLAADVATSMERWQKSQRFVMIDRARVPQKPTRPKRLLLIPLGVMLSLALSAAGALLMARRKNVLLGEWELPADIVVLGRIPPVQVESLS